MKFILVLCFLITATTFAKTLKVMSYNAHNLFDTKHDYGKNDWEYLPKDYPGKKEACEAIESNYYRQKCLKSDWTKEKFDLKISQLSKVINDSGKPDFLALSEVENTEVVIELAKKIGYNKFIVTNSPDKRGIDVALAFNESGDVEFIEAKEYQVKGTKYFKEKPTRNILEVVVKIAGEPVSFLVNHWPSQGNPTINRLAAAKTLKKVINKRARRSKGHKFIVLGDFNTLKEDHPHPFRSVLLTEVIDDREPPKSTPIKDMVRKLFRKPVIKDMHTTYMSSSSELISDEAKAKMPRGTYFYAPKFTWNLLDRVFFSENLTTSGKVIADIGSYKIETPSFAVTDVQYDEPSSYMNGSIVRGVPLRSDHNATRSSAAGYSDHFPVSFNLVIK